MMTRLFRGKFRLKPEERPTSADKLFTLYIIEFRVLLNTQNP
jgi:hypothetical protein